MAGSDSVSVALAWCLHLLAHHPEVQNRLRKELGDLPNSLASGTADSDDNSWCEYRINTTSGSSNGNRTLDDIEYLDFFVKEVLRLCPPVHATIRVAKKDDMIPVSAPTTLPNSDKVTSDQSGITYVPIRKGTYIHVPIEGLSHSEDLWGADALEFKYASFKLSFAIYPYFLQPRSVERHGKIEHDKSTWAPWSHDVWRRIPFVSWPPLHRRRDKSVSFGIDPSFSV